VAMALTVVGTGGCVGVEKRGRCRCRSDPKQNGTLAAEVRDRKNNLISRLPLISRWANFGTGVNGIPSQAWNPDGAADHNGSYCIKPPHRTPSRARGQRRRPLARAARIGATTMAISSDASGAALATPAAETLQVRRQLGRAPAR
jgi:hypothetical protein